MAAPYVKSDSVNVQTLKLASLDGKRTYDFRGQVAEFSIYEDIMFPVIRAEFTIVDAVDILTSFPIIGEELITVEISNPGFDLVNSYTFHVKSVENQIINQSGKIRTYVIKAASEEFNINNRQFITKKYSTDTTSVVQDIMQNILGTQKTIAVEPTKGIQTLLFSRIRPLQAVDMVRKRAISQKYISSSYVFFENKRGFNFCTIEFLLDQLQENVNDKLFFYDTAGNSDNKNMNTRNILSMMSVSQLNNTSKLTNGSLNNTVKKFDLLTGVVTRFNFKNSEQQQNFKFASNNALGLNSTNFEQNYGDTPSTAMLVPHSSHLPDNFIADQMGAKHSFVTKIAQNIYNAYINGDVALTAGDVIQINIINPTGASGATKENRLTGGKYLISKIRHIVLNKSSEQPSYTCALELIKGNYEDNA